MSPRNRRENAASSVEFLLLVPVLIVLFVVLVQAGLRMHAARVAQVAAREGAVEAARYDGTAAAGRGRAIGYIESAGATAIRSSSVTVGRTATTASATVTVTPLVLMPVPGILDGSTAVTATSPVERFVP